MTRSSRYFLYHERCLRILLARIKSTLLSHRRTQQSGLHQDASLVSASSLCNIAQHRQTMGVQRTRPMLIFVLPLTLSAAPNILVVVKTSSADADKPARRDVIGPVGLR